MKYIWTIPVVLSIALFLSLLIAYGFRPINPADYPERLDYGTLTTAEQDAFNDILSAVADGQPVVRCDEHINHYKVLTHLGMYYGTLGGVGRLFVMVNGNIHLNLNAFPEYEQKRTEVNAMVAEALPHIREGSDRFKLWQIARYIATHNDYGQDFRCGEYAILFYKIASRLGIQTYLCFGFSGDDLHVWNMANGYFYDVTWFDNTQGHHYIHSRNQWGRCSAINDMWEVITP